MEEGAILAASTINEMVYGYCGPVCFMGDCDEQLKFELAQDTVAEYNVISVFQGRNKDSSNTKSPQETLFDEASVVSGASR